MAYGVKILADSMGPNGHRITTWELTYPRFVHAELMTHRLFSRNSASSRAIPTKKLMRQVRLDPAMPVWWGKNQSGMQAREELAGWRKRLATFLWLETRWLALLAAWLMMKAGLHKQIANRVLEPWMFITVIGTATELDNWFRLRCHPDAQPEIGWVARRMKELYDSSQPTFLKAGDWHVPMVDFVEHFEMGHDWDLIRKVAVARLARVSYLTHDGRKSYEEDTKLHDRLAEDGHWSPFEHVAQAQPQSINRWSGNFHGWTQYREIKDPNFTHVGR
jgi:hypothetical protein